MKKRAIVVVAVVMMSALVGVAQGDAQGVTQEIETVNLSDGRDLGVGIQVDFPFGGLVSTRYWFDPTLGLEGIIFLWGDAGDLEGSLTARMLYRIADAPVVDFYGAIGASMPFSSYGYGFDPIILSAAGGIEFGFRSAPSLAWNIEFGISVSAYGDIQMLFGTGVHFYFFDVGEEGED